MAKKLGIITPLKPLDNPGQKGMSYSNAFLAGFLPILGSHPTFDGNAWRRVVKSQPIAMICKDNLISSLLALDWKITPRDSDKREELSATIRYYTKLIEKGMGGLDFVGIVEWVAGDALDTPFGGVAEVGRAGDKPNGRVQWVEPLDSATFYPTYNKDFPCIQRYNGYEVSFPAHAIARSYFNPISNIVFKGWGSPPPERAYLALDMISRGDNYYANLMLDIPPVGILDLGDMERSAALEWVEGYKAVLTAGGNASFKVPVLYEHNGDIKFVAFGKAPNDIMFDQIIIKYASILCAAYGMGLSDIGIQAATSGGDTLAGSIRSERNTRRTGRAKLKKKIKNFWEQILPDFLRFDWIDYDDELSIALGRGRLATAQAWNYMIKDGIITPQEARMQSVADGLLSITISEKISDDALPPLSTGLEVSGSTSGAPTNMLGDPVPVSSGGHGEVKKYLIDKSKLKALVSGVLENTVVEFNGLRDEYGLDYINVARSQFQNNLYDETDPYGDMLAKVNIDDVITFDESFPEEVKPSVYSVVKKSTMLALSNVLLTDDYIDFSDGTVYDMVLKSVTDMVDSASDMLIIKTLEAHENRR